MSITRVPGEQLIYRSSATGDHVLDQYLEDAEIGGKTLAELLDTLFNDFGEPEPSAFTALLGLELRVNAVTKELTFGYSANPGQDDPTGSYIFAWKGAWAATTAYKTTDLLTYLGVTYVVTADFTSPGSFTSTNLSPISTGITGTVNADATDPAAGTLDEKLSVPGGIISVVEDGVRKVQIDIRPALKKYSFWMGG